MFSLCRERWKPSVVEASKQKPNVSQAATNVGIDWDMSYQLGDIYRVGLFGSRGWETESFVRSERV